MFNCRVHDPGTFLLGDPDPMVPICTCKEVDGYARERLTGIPPRIGETAEQARARGVKVAANVPDRPRWRDEPSWVWYAHPTEKPAPTPPPGPGKATP